MTRSVTAERHLGFDILRILSAIAVITIHVSAPIMTSPDIFEQGDLFWWFSNLLDSLSRFSVPMFVIFSGYSFSLLVNHKQFADKSRMKFIKLIEITLFWSVIFILYRLVKGDFSNVVNMIDIFILAVAKPLLAGLPYFHLWYLYMVLGLFFIAIYLTPFLNQVSQKRLKTFLFSVMVFSLLFSFQNYYYDNKLLFIFWFIEYLFYFIFGFYILRLNFNFNRALSIIGFILVVALNAFLVRVMVEVYGADRGQYFYEFVSPFVMLQTLLLFNVFMLINKKSPELIVLLSRLTLPVYLVHPFITEVVVSHVKEMHSIVYLILGIILSVLLSFLLSFLLYKIPGVKRFAV